MLNAALPHIHGYYRDGRFYDSNNNIIVGAISRLFVDDATEKFYYYDGNQFVLIDSEE